MRDPHGNTRRLYAFSFLHKTLFPMAIITLFWKEHIGLTLTQILLLQSIFSIATVMLDYPAGYLSDRLGYRVALNIASLFGIVGWGIYTVASTFTHVMAAEIMLGISLSFISGSDSALLYETLRAEGKEHLYARFEGRMNGFGQSGEALGALFAGVIYAAAPLLPFFLQVGVWLAALGVTRLMVETKRESFTAPRSHLAEALRTARYAFIDNRRLRYTILLGTLLGIASFFPVWLIQPYMRQAGVPLAWFGPVWTVANLTVVIGALASHRMQYRLGDRKMVILFVSLIAAGYFGLGIVGGVWGFLFYYLLTIMRGLRGPMLLDHLQAESPSANRASILSLQSVSFRIFFACTAPFVGKMADTLGVQQTFHLLLYAFLVTLPVFSLLFLRNSQGDKGI
jgi:predicted MFS family arabinose efflux permease